MRRFDKWLAQSRRASTRLWWKLRHRGLELEAKPKVYTDLDDFIGSWLEDAAIDKALEEFDRIDQEMWS